MAEDNEKMDAAKQGDRQDVIKAGSSPIQQYKVLHGAVSGFEPDPKNPGKTRDKDYYTGVIVTDEHLGGRAAMYISLGAIAPVD